MERKFLVITTESIPGYRIKKAIGGVSASVVHARHNW